jgi:hypothetical protein
MRWPPYDAFAEDALILVVFCAITLIVLAFLTA